MILRDINKYKVDNEEVKRIGTEYNPALITNTLLREANHSYNI